VSTPRVGSQTSFLVERSAGGVSTVSFLGICGEATINFLDQTGNVKVGFLG
jgi:hypothetical protein